MNSLKIQDVIVKKKFLNVASQLGNKAGGALSSTATKASALAQEHKPNEQEMAQAKAWVMNAATVDHIQNEGGD